MMLVGTAYLLVADIFASTGMQNDAEKLEAYMRSKKYAIWSKKQENNLWVDSNGNIHSFSIRNVIHSGELYRER